MKKSLLLLALFSFILGSCGGGDDNPTPSAPESRRTLLTKSVWIKRSQTFVQPVTLNGVLTSDAFTNIFGIDYADNTYKWNADGTFRYGQGGGFDDVIIQGTYTWSTWQLVDSSRINESIIQNNRPANLFPKDIVKLTNDSLVTTEAVNLQSTQGQTVTVPVTARYTRQ